MFSETSSKPQGVRLSYGSIIDTDICGETYLWQARITRIYDNPANLDHLSTILGDIDSVFVAGGCNVDNAELLKLMVRWRRSVMALS